MKAHNWKRIFHKRPDLYPPGYLQCVVDTIIDNLWKGWSAEILRLEEECKKKNKKGNTGERITINYGKGRFQKHSIVALYHGPRWGWRGKYIVKTDLDLGRQLVKIQNTETKSIQWVSEKNLRRI